MVSTGRAGYRMANMRGQQQARIVLFFQVSPCEVSLKSSSGGLTRYQSHQDFQQDFECTANCN